MKFFQFLVLSLVLLGISQVCFASWPDDLKIKRAFILRNPSIPEIDQKIILQIHYPDLDKQTKTIINKSIRYANDPVFYGTRRQLHQLHGRFSVLLDKEGAYQTTFKVYEPRLGRKVEEEFTILLYQNDEKGIQYCEVRNPLQPKDKEVYQKMSFEELDRLDNSIINRQTKILEKPYTPWLQFSNPTEEISVNIATLPQGEWKTFYPAGDFRIGVQLNRKSYYLATDRMHFKITQKTEGGPWSNTYFEFEGELRQEEDLAYRRAEYPLYVKLVVDGKLGQAFFTLEKKTYTLDSEPGLTQNPNEYPSLTNSNAFHTPLDHVFQVSQMGGGVSPSIHSSALIPQSNVRAEEKVQIKVHEDLAVGDSADASLMDFVEIKASPQGVSVPAAGLKKVDEDQSFCKICMDAKICDQKLPACGHQEFCEPCLKQLEGKPCPICRGPVKIIQIFRSDK